MKNCHPEVFRLTHNIFGYNQIKKDINSLTYFNKVIPADINKVIDGLRVQCQEIYLALMPLVDCGIIFDMWLVGGSVRDLLLKKHDQISGLDIMISFAEHDEKKTPSIKKFLKTTGINPELHSAWAWPQGDKSIKPFHHWSKFNSKFYHDRQKISNKINYEMTAVLLEDKFSIEIPTTNSSRIKSFLTQKLQGIIKLNAPHWKWGCDVLVTNTQPMNFLSHFDFDICKVAVELSNSLLMVKGVDYYPTNNKEFLQHVIFNKLFLNDYQSKTINMDASIVTVFQLQHSCEIHLPKLLQKYDWPVFIKACHDPDQFSDFKLHKMNEQILNDKQQYINAFFMSSKLSKTLKEKDNYTTLHKI